MFKTSPHSVIRIRLVITIFALSCAMVTAYCVWFPVSSNAAATELFFSEYIEGSSNNKALEIFNGTGTAVNLGTAGYNVQMFFNGSATAGLTINLVGTVASGDVFVLAQSSANPAILAQADQTNGAGWFNGDDAVVLRKGTTVIDVIGQIGFDPGTEWGTGLTSTADNTLRRKPNICAGDTNGSDVFDPSIQWDGFATDNSAGLGSHISSCFETEPAVSSTTPTSDATDVAVNSNVSINFNEPVNVTGSWFNISCATSGVHTATVSGGPQSYTLDPDNNFAFSEKCTVTVFASQVSDQDLDDPPDQLSANYVWSFTTGADPCTSPYTNIFTVQGSGNSSPLVGTNQTIRGIVTGDFQGSSSFNGFFVQDSVGDGNVATSDGIFVFAPGGLNVSVGDDVVVRGQVQEFFALTEIGNVTSIAQCGTGSVVPTLVDLPETVEGELERYEGMLVTIPEALSVTEVFNLGRFGELKLSSDGRLFQPTNSNLPNSPGALAEADGNLRRQIVLDDGRNDQNPNPIPYLGPANTVRLGDTVAGLTGNLDFRFSEYRIQPTSTPTFSYINTRPATPNSVGGNVKVASMNVLNYFNGDGMGGGFPTARGADTLIEFNRQRAKIIVAITTIDADVVGVSEMENDGGGATSAVQDLVNGLNAATAPGTYAFRLGTTPGTDLIMNAILYKPSRVTPIGSAVNDVDSAWLQARNPLAQLFEYNANGERFTFIVNHFTSKSCSASDTGPDADQGDGQGCDNFQRTLQAQRLLTFVGAMQTAGGDPDVIAMGDLNAYGKEDPIQLLSTGGLINELESHITGERYSFVFGGQSGYLDHAFSTSSMSTQVSGVTEWHINADEPPVLDYNTEFKTVDLFAPTPYRSADHDPVIVGLDLNAAPTIQTLTATPNPAIVNGAVNFAATFSDPDVLDTHTAIWQWGDGTSSSGVVSGGNVSNTHTYSSVGSYEVTLTVTDSHNNSDSETLTVKVTYGIQLLYDPNKLHKGGSTVALKIQLVDALGNNVSNGATIVHLTAVKLNSTAVSGSDYDSGEANPDNDFRFDSSLGGTGGYVFNLSTKNLGLGSGEYTACFTVSGDPVEHSMTFKVK